MLKRILLVDDDPDDVDMFQEALSEVDANAQFVTAPNGKKALDKVEELGHLGVIFLDINMPIMGGLECLSELKKKKTVKDVPVLMYSTSSNKRDSQKAKQLGALCFVIKPDEYNHLKKIIRTVLSHLETGKMDSLCEAVHKI
jgi:PleD family two-component response regulator